MGLSLEKIRNGISEGISQNKLGFGSIDEIRSGCEDFQWGGIVRGSLDFVIYNIAILFHSSEIKSIEVYPMRDLKWQKSKLENFCFRVQAIRPDGLITGGYVGRIGNYDYAGFGFGLSAGENTEEQIQGNSKDTDKEIIVPIPDKTSLLLVKKISEENIDNLQPDEIINQLVSMGDRAIPALHKALTDGSVCEHILLVDTLAKLGETHLLAYQIVDMIANNILPVNDPNAFKSAFRAIATIEEAPKAGGISAVEKETISTEFYGEEKKDAGEIFCPGCNESYKVTKNILDKKVSCACGLSFNVTLDGKIAGQELLVDLNNSLSEIKPCPFCAEPIQVSAKKCKHCSEWLDKGDREKDSSIPEKKLTNDSAREEVVSKCVEAERSLFLSCMSIVMGPLTGIPAIILGHMATSRIKESKGLLKGKEKALAGLVVGYFTTIAFGLLLAILIPQYLKKQDNLTKRLGEKAYKEKIDRRKKALEEGRKNSKLSSDRILKGGQAIESKVNIIPAVTNDIFGEWELIARAEIIGENEVKNIVRASCLKLEGGSKSSLSLVSFTSSLMSTVMSLESVPFVKDEVISISGNTIKFEKGDAVITAYTGELEMGKRFVKILILKRSAFSADRNSFVYIMRGEKNPLHDGSWKSLLPMKDYLKRESVDE